VRCSEAFSLDNIDHAFHFCFGRYKACPIYVELLIERRVRRAAAGSLAADSHHASRNRYIQVKVLRSAQTDGDAELVAHDARIPALPGVGEGIGR
jgi:hypothetical protein